MVTATYVSRYAIRKTVLDSIEPKAAIKEGFYLLKKGLGKSIQLSLGNCLVQGVLAAGIVMAIVMTVLMLVGIFTPLWQMEAVKVFLIVFLVIFAAPVFIALILFLTALQGYFTTAREITWTTLYKYLKDQA
jgi:hypothetical protein